MGKKKIVAFISFSIFITILLVLVANEYFRRLHVPQAGMFVFGDSTVDVGRSNSYNTTYKSNYYPYAVDTYEHSSNSFSNRDTLANSIASKIAMQSPKSIANIKDFSGDIKAGLNYAFGASGVLSNTGKKFGVTIPLHEQIEHFTASKKSYYMSTLLKSENELQKYISNSVYLISVGQNDIFEYFEQGAKQAFPTDVVVDGIMKCIKVLYEIGARKIVVFEVQPIGCSPLILSTSNNDHGRCHNNTVNKVVSNFNKCLETAIAEFKKSRLAAKKIILGKTFEFTKKMISNEHLVYGLMETKRPCCTIDKEGLCIRTGGKICDDRGKVLYFDGRHFTDFGYTLIAEACVNDELLNWKFNTPDD